MNTRLITWPRKGIFMDIHLKDGQVFQGTFVKKEGRTLYFRDAYCTLCSVALRHVASIGGV